MKLFSRNLKDATSQYPAIARAITQLHADTALLDGELVAVDERGLPSFQALHHQSAATVVFYAFDLLHVDGRDLLKVPLDERRAALTPVVQGTTILRSEPLPGTPDQIEVEVRRLQLEGVIAKRRLSRYEPGRRSHAWVKVKFNRRQEFVIGGLKLNATSLESLLVGYYEGKELNFAGKVRAGLTPHVRGEILRAIASDKTTRCPFVNLSIGKTTHWSEGISEEEMTRLLWVKPKLVVEVSFVEWTRDGLLRHPQFVGIRHDKNPAQVRRELT